MRRISRIFCLLLILAAVAGCSDVRSTNAAPTPKPDPIADVNPESGTMGALAFAMTEALGIKISAGADAAKPAQGVGAAKLAVTALGLDLELRMGTMGMPPTDADYLSLALEYDIAPASLFTSSAMTAGQIKAFAEAVAGAKERGVGFAFEQREWAPAELDAETEIAVQLAVIAYNPLAEGRGVYRYGAGDAASLAYWSLAALGSSKADANTPQDAAPFITINDQTDKVRGTTTVNAEDFAAFLSQTWGVLLPANVSGLSTRDGRLYLSAPADDYVRQYPIPYRAERSGDFLKVYVDVLNNVIPAQYAGKAAVILRKSADTLLGWQIASIEPSTEPLPRFEKVFAQATAEGFQAVSLIDGDPKTVWQIGNATADTAQIVFNFAEPTSITGLAIYNGDHSGDDANLRRYKSASIVGIRFSEDAQKDDMRVDLSANLEDFSVLREIVLPFGREIETDTVILVFYGQSGGYIRISDVRAF